MTCPNGTVDYTCTVEGIQIQWIAEPFINESGPSILYVLNVNSTLDTIVFDHPPIVIRHTSVTPFVSVLSVNNSVIQEDLNIVCSIPQAYSSLSYVAPIRGKYIFIHF